MRALRTPEERFQNLAGFPYPPNYLEVDDGERGRLRLHYVDEGRPTASRCCACTGPLFPDDPRTPCTTPRMTRGNNWPRWSSTS